MDVRLTSGSSRSKSITVTSVPSPGRFIILDKMVGVVEVLSTST